jgi:hypothetical protein
MGFSGGGSNVLLPHTHDGRVSQDGGPLQFNNVTQSQSAAGEVFYSDGTALQQLVLGAASDELRVNAGATAPEWYTPAAGVSTWTSLADVVIAGVAGNLTSGIFASHNLLYISIFAGLNVAQGQSIILNSDGAAGQYAGRDFRNGTMFTSSNRTCIQYGFGATTNWINTTFFINQRTAGEKMVSLTATEQTGTGGVNHPSQSLGSWMWRNTVDDIDEVTIATDGGAAAACQVGSRMIVLGAS